MAKQTTDTVEDNHFGGFKFIDKPVPKTVNKAKTEDEPQEDEKKEKVPNQAQLDAEANALKEASEAAERSKAKKEGIKAKAEEAEIEEEEQEEQEAEQEEAPDTETVLATFAKELSKKGILDLEETDEIKSDDDLYKVYERTVKKGIAEDRTRLPEDAQKFLEFIDNGGNPAEFHRIYYSTDGGSFEEFVMEGEEDQKHVVREGLALEGYTPEEIEEEINDLVDLEKLEKKAQIQLKKLQKVEKEQKKLLLESQKEHARKQEEKRQAEWAEFKKGLFDKEEIAGFKFTTKMKEENWDYMTKIVNKKEGLTQYQIDSKENPDARYLFAYLLKNKWDVKSLEKQVNTKVVSKLATKLGNYTDSRNKIKTGTPAKEKGDTEVNPFGGFKTIL